MPRVDCPGHGIKQAKISWTREGSRLTLLFKQAAMTPSARDARIGGRWSSST
ncbi:hypothetical protein DFAR_1270001 [Desulfarculales bacterium]